MEQKEESAVRGPVSDTHPAFLISRVALNDIIEASSWLVDEVCLRFNKDGVWARFTDPAKICMVELNLPKEKFVQYNFEGEAVLSIDVDAIKSMLRNVEKSEKVFGMKVAETPPKHGDGGSIKHLVITVDSPFDSSGYIRYKIPPLEKWQIRSRGLSLTLPTTVPINAPQMFLAVEALEGFMDHLALKYEAGALILSCESDYGSRCVAMAIDGGEACPARSLLPMDYFRGLVRANRNAKEAFLSIGNDLPVVLTTIMPSGLSVMTAIAPRIEED